MVANRLESYISDGIARRSPLEGGPAWEAWQNGLEITAATWGGRRDDMVPIMADTWGGYVSRLGEHLGEDVPLDELLGKLYITRGALNDSSVHFSEAGEFRYYVSGVLRKIRQEAEDYYAPEVKRLERTFDAIVESYRVPDEAAARQEADRIQAEITAIETAFLENNIARNYHPTDEEHDAHERAQAQRCMRRDVLDSGYAVTLDRFVHDMLEVNLIDDGDFRSELAPVWLRSLKTALAFLLREYADRGLVRVAAMKSEDIVVDAAVLYRMRDDLEDIYSEVEEYARRRWEEIMPAFVADHGAIERLIKPAVEPTGEK